MIDRLERWVIRTANRLRLWSVSLWIAEQRINRACKSGDFTKFTGSSHGKVVLYLRRKAV